MKRFARWLRLVVACLAFVITAAPAVALDAREQIVLVAEDESREDSRVAVVEANAVIADVERPAAPIYESPRFVSRRWLVSCALLL